MVLQLYDCVLQCQKPGCPSWIFLRKLGYQPKWAMCKTSWSKSYPMGCSTHQELMAKKAMKKKTTKGQEKKNAMKAMKAMKATKTMKDKASKNGIKGMKAIKPMKDKAIKPMKDKAMKSMKAK